MVRSIHGLEERFWSQRLQSLRLLKIYDENGFLISEKLKQNGMFDSENSFSS